MRLFPIMLFAGCELLAAVTRYPKLRKTLFGLALLANIVSIYFVLVITGLSWAILGIFGIAATTLFAYRILNCLRAIFGRMQKDHEYRVVLKSTLSLITAQLVLFGVGSAFLFVFKSYDYTFWITALALGLSAACLVSTVLTLSKSRVPPILPLADADLPSVSICIPARNENNDMADCLESILASNYPKLEVIVFDDNSHDRTPEIIKDFANRGVRFIGGEEPRAGWLAKNQAYQTLMDAALGDYVLFCGVDVRFEPGTLKTLLALLRGRRKSMLSVMPRLERSLPYASLIQPMRYWWELAWPRRLFKHPPVLSTCWIIERKVLEDLGGFKAVDNTIVPESYFARRLADILKYSFVRAGRNLPLYSQKNLNNQKDTALRTRYPQLRKRPEWVWLMSTIELYLFIMPFVLSIIGIFVNLGPAWYLALAASALLMAAHTLITLAWNPGNWLLEVLSFPLAVIYDVVLMNLSMFKYEFGRVIWKERNIAEPVMHVIPRLPKA